MPKLKQFNKEKVLEAASGIFHQKGYNGTSIDEILKATGLSRSSLYDSFRDKHSLYLEALEFYRNREATAYSLMDSRKLNGFEKVELLFSEVVKYLLANPDGNGCLMVNAAAEMSKHCDKTSQVICNNREQVQELFTGWLEEAETVKAKKLGKPAAAYAPFLFNALCGLKVLSQSGASREELENVVKITLEALS
jgi:TetR/AcrR family transcriptional regulator, transcriptional repressor for nem operon